MKCPNCGEKLEKLSDSLYTCYTCYRQYMYEEGRGLIDLVIKLAGNCENCGESLAGGEFVEGWEDNYNSNGYTICPHCHYRNYR